MSFKFNRNDPFQILNQSSFPQQKISKYNDEQNSLQHNDHLSDYDFEKQFKNQFNFAKKNDEGEVSNNEARRSFRSAFFTIFNTKSHYDLFCFNDEENNPSNEKNNNEEIKFNEHDNKPYPSYEDGSNENPLFGETQGIKSFENKNLNGQYQKQSSNSLNNDSFLNPENQYSSIQNFGSLNLNSNLNTDTSSLENKHSNFNFSNKNYGQINKLISNSTIATPNSLTDDQNFTIKHNKFIDKLQEILSNNSLHNIISWDSEGKLILIKNKSKLESEVIPFYFKHNKYSNFVRQLNIYKFKKIKEFPEKNYTAYQNPFFSKETQITGFSMLIGSNEDYENNKSLSSLSNGQNEKIIKTEKNTDIMNTKSKNESFSSIYNNGEKDGNGKSKNFFLNKKQKFNDWQFIKEMNEKLNLIKNKIEILEQKVSTLIEFNEKQSDQLNCKNEISS